MAGRLLSALLAASLAACAGAPVHDGYVAAGADTFARSGDGTELHLLHLPRERIEAGRPLSVSAEREFATGSVNSRLFYDHEEIWFRSQVLAIAAGSLTIRHRGVLQPPAAADRRFMTRGWIEFDRPLPAGYRVAVVERIRTEAGAEHLREKALVDDGRAGRRFLELPPVPERAVELSGIDEAIAVEYTVTLAGEGEPVSMQVSLSPQWLSARRWQDEIDARSTGAGRIAALDESHGARLLARLYADTASDYVQAHLEPDKRLHCYLHAEQVREWYRRVALQYPVIDERFRFTGVRRSPAWQSSNMISVRDGTPVREHFDGETGVIVDTWLGTYTTRPRVQTVDEFRRMLSYVRMEETVRVPLE